MARQPKQDNKKTTLSVDKSTKTYLRRIASKKNDKETENDNDVVMKIVKHWIDSGKPISPAPLNTYVNQKTSSTNSGSTIN